MEGWKTSSLEEVVKFIDYRGKTPEKKEAGLRLITAKNVKMGYLQTNPMEFVDPSIYHTWMTRGIPKKGDVLFTTEAPLGNVAQLDTDERVVFAQRIIVMQPDREVLDPTFLKYMLLSGLMQKRIHEKGTGATVQGIKSQLLKKVQIAFPKSLHEQKRIVVILDEAFEGIDRAIVNTEKNLASAHELFESYLNTIFIQKGDRWVEKKLDAICMVERGSSPRPIKQYLTESSDGVNWVKISDTQGIHKYIHSTRQKITKEGAKRSRRVEPGDFILTNSMSYGKPYIMATIGYIHDGWFVLRLSDTINIDFFYYLLSSNLVQDQFKSLASGSVVKNISSDLVKKAVLPIPPLSEQKSIVDVIEELVAATQRLEAIYQQKLAALNELKQAILEKAFAGELTSDIVNQATKSAKEVIAA